MTTTHNCMGQCPLLGVKRTLVSHSATSDFDPKRTLRLDFVRSHGATLIEGFENEYTINTVY
jgi:hypothetical protein